MNILVIILIYKKYFLLTYLFLFILSYQNTTSVVSPNNRQGLRWDLSLVIVCFFTCLHTNTQMNMNKMHLSECCMILLFNYFVDIVFRKANRKVQIQYFSVYVQKRKIYLLCLILNVLLDTNDLKQNNKYSQNKHNDKVIININQNSEYIYLYCMLFQVALCNCGAIKWRNTRIIYI